MLTEEVTRMKIAEMSSASVTSLNPLMSAGAAGETQSIRVAAAQRTQDREEEAEGGEEQSSGGSQEDLQAAVDQLNQTANAFNRSVRFDLSDESGRVQVSVVDTDNDEVIREIPPEVTLNVAKRIRDFLGVFLDEKR